MSWLRLLPINPRILLPRLIIFMYETFRHFHVQFSSNAPPPPPPVFQVFQSHFSKSVTHLLHSCHWFETLEVGCFHITDDNVFYPKDNKRTSLRYASNMFWFFYIYIYIYLCIAWMNAKIKQKRIWRKLIYTRKHKPVQIIRTTINIIFNESTRQIFTPKLYIKRTKHFNSVSLTCGYWKLNTVLWT